MNSTQCQPERKNQTPDHTVLKSVSISIFEDSLKGTHTAPHPPLTQSRERSGKAAGYVQQNNPLSRHHLRARSSKGKRILPPAPASSQIFHLLYNTHLPSLCKNQKSMMEKNIIPPHHIYYLRLCPLPICPMPAWKKGV